MQTLNEKQAELDAAKQKLEDGKKQLENSRSEYRSGLGRRERRAG